MDVAVAIGASAVDEMTFVAVGGMTPISSVPHAGNKSIVINTIPVNIERKPYLSLFIAISF
jgi:hypothetical protein